MQLHHNFPRGLCGCVKKPDYMTRVFWMKMETFDGRGDFVSSTQP